MPKDMLTHCLGWELYVWETETEECGTAKQEHSVSISVIKALLGENPEQAQAGRIWVIKQYCMELCDKVQGFTVYHRDSFETSATIATAFFSCL